MAHFSTIFAMAGSSDTTRFGSLEFPALPLVEVWVPPIFEPSYAFLFESLDFVADRLGVLHLHEETRVPESMENVTPTGAGSRVSSMARHPRFIPSKLSAQTPL